MCPHRRGGAVRAPGVSRQRREHRLWVTGHGPHADPQDEEAREETRLRRGARRRGGPGPRAPPGKAVCSATRVPEARGLEGPGLIVKDEGAFSTVTSCPREPSGRGGRTGTWAPGPRPDQSPECRAEVGEAAPGCVSVPSASLTSSASVALAPPPPSPGARRDQDAGVSPPHGLWPRASWGSTCEDTDPRRLHSLQGRQVRRSRGGSCHSFRLRPSSSDGKLVAGGLPARLLGSLRGAVKAGLSQGCTCMGGGCAQQARLCGKQSPPLGPGLGFLLLLLRDQVRCPVGLARAAPWRRLPGARSALCLPRGCGGRVWGGNLLGHSG